MKVSSINATQVSLTNRKIKETPPNTESQIPQGMYLISFKSGNPKHIAHIVAEEPLFGFSGGGVGTVSNDYNFLEKGYEKILKIIPMYNQEVVFKEDIDTLSGQSKGTIAQGVEVRKIPDNLPANHPLKKYEGVAFVTPEKIDKTTNLPKLLEEKRERIFLLDEVTSSKMNWGMQEDTPIKMFKARKDENLIKIMDKKGMPKGLQEKIEFIFTFVDATSSLNKPYADGSYASLQGDDLSKRFASGWKGQEYAKFDKATVETLPALKSKFGWDPAYILCSDGQSMFTMHYAAQKNAAGDSYWLDKFLGGVGHNMNAGYDQPMGARQAIVNLGATKEEIEKLLNSKEYLEALKLGEEEKFLRETVLKDFYRPEAGMTAFHVPIHYAKKGYVPMLSTVSEGYHQSIITNPLVSKMYGELKEIDALGHFKGITNPLMDPNVTPFADTILQGGYKKDVKLKLANGSEVVIEKFKVFDKEKKYDLNHVREVKRHNKISLFERFNPKYVGAQAYNSKTGDWLNADTGRMEITTGAADRKAKIYGEIDSKYIKGLKEGKDIKLVVSWGRGDHQKGMDTVIEAFEKYAKKDPNAVLILGGDMKFNPSIVDKFKKVSQKDFTKGRMVFMDGWTPGKDFAMAADVALLPSRFAPCELTDLEAKKALCTPVVPRVQGMGQKNFDPLVPEEAKLMDAYVGKHEFFMTEETALKAANNEAKEKFNEAIAKLEKEIKSKYKGEVGKDIPDNLLQKTIKNHGDYSNALNKLRDSVIADEMAECLERALITDRNSEIPAKILKNQVDADTKWFGNSWLSKTGKSSGELYHEYHFSNKGKNISEKDLIKLDFSGLTETGTKEAKEKAGSGIKGIFKGKAAKWAVGIAGAAALIGLGYKLYNGKPLSNVQSRPVERDYSRKTGHLSEVV